MVPEFPEFKDLELSDKSEIENCLSELLPYSDFNFTSLWCWNVSNQTKISKLNGNFVLKISDYTSSDIFYTFFGNNNLDNTVEKILNYSSKDGVGSFIKFIPEEIASCLNRGKFIINEDIDHFDYILDNEKLIEYKGSALHNHANFKKRFKAEHEEKLQVKEIDFNDQKYEEDIKKLNEQWVDNRVTQAKEIVPELEEKAIKRIFDLAKDNDKFCSVALYKEGQMIAFTIDELLTGDYAIRHFMKGNTNLKGVYSYIVSESSKKLLEKGKKYTNIEQDLGLGGLRQAKRSYAPIGYLKKYTVSRVV